MHQLHLFTVLAFNHSRFPFNVHMFIVAPQRSALEMELGREGDLHTQQKLG